MFVRHPFNLGSRMATNLCHNWNRSPCLKSPRFAMCWILFWYVGPMRCQKTVLRSALIAMYTLYIYIYTHTYPSDFPAEITHQNTFRPTSRLVMKPWLAQAPAEVDRVSSCPGWHVLMCMSYWIQERTRNPMKNPRNCNRFPDSWRYRKKKTKPGLETIPWPIKCGQDGRGVPKLGFPRRVREWHIVYFCFWYWGCTPVAMWLWVKIRYPKIMDG